MNGSFPVYNNNDILLLNIFWGNVLENFDLPLSIIATILAFLSFCGSVWRIWRDRPRLIFYIRKITFTNLPKGGPMTMVRFTVCNVGYRPIILTRFVAYGESSMFSMGIDDAPAAAFGVEDHKFPTLLDAGGLLKIHPLSVHSIERNMTDPKDEKVHFDPWKYFVLIDSFGRFHPVDADDVRFELGLKGSRRKNKGLRKIFQIFRRRKFLKRVKKKFDV